MHKVVLVALATLLIVPLSGCVASDDAPSTGDALGEVEACLEGDDGTQVCGDAILDDTGRDLRKHLKASDSLEAPTWEVGDVFEQHMYFGQEDTSGQHIKTMVVDDSGSCYQVATNDQLAAKEEAVYDYPILGCIGKEHLDTEAFGISWDWMYDFPLEDNKTWTADIEGMINFNDYSFPSYKVTFQVAYDPAIDTAFGDYPGFQITGTNETGEKLAYYNYVPAVGWFSHFWLYDLNTDDPEDIQFHAMSMGTSSGYEGIYYIDENEEIYDSAHGIAPPQGPGGQPMIQPMQPTTVTMPEEATYLVGIVVNWAFVGRSETTLVTPSNEARQYAAEALGVEFAFAIAFLDEEILPGDWQLSHTGAGGATGTYIWLNAVTEIEHTLGPAEPATAEA